MEKQPIIIEAYKCPDTGKVFTEREKYEKFVEHRALAKKHREESVEFKRTFNERFKALTSVYQMLDLIKEFFIKDATFRQQNGRPVDKIEVLLPGSPKVTMNGEFLVLHDVLIQISHRDVYHKNNLIHREGFDNIINSSIDFILMRDKSNYTKHSEHSKFIFHMLIHLEAIPLFYESVKNYAHLLHEKKKWNKKNEEAAHLAISTSDELIFGKDRSVSIEEMKEQIRKFDIEIDALTARRATVMGQYTDMQKQRDADIKEAFERIMLDAPFEKQKEIEDIPSIDQIVYRMLITS